MILLHWLANLSSAMFVYWQEDAGRYALFVATLLLDLVLIYLYFHKRTKLGSANIEG